jgi:hypothetical protein
MFLSLDLFCQSTIDLNKLTFSLKDVRSSIANNILKEHGFVLVTKSNVDSINRIDLTNYNLYERIGSCSDYYYYIKHNGQFSIHLYYFDHTINYVNVTLTESIPSASEMYQKFKRIMKSTAVILEPDNDYEERFKIGNIFVGCKVGINSETGKVYYEVNLK